MVPTGQLLRGSTNSGQILDSYTLSNILLLRTNQLAITYYLYYVFAVKYGISHYLIRADQSAHYYTFSQFTIKRWNTALIALTGTVESSKRRTRN